MKLCALCGRVTNTTHHLIFGWSQRRLSDADKLTIDLCDECHNMAIKPQDRVHGNNVAEKLSKMLGQALWEKDYLAHELEELRMSDLSREKFIQRYGRSYL